MSAGILSAEHEVGDVGIAWTEDEDATMEALIQRKMDEGVRFFVVASVGERTEIQRIQDIPDRKVVFGDEDIQRMFDQGRVGFMARLRAGFQVLRRTTDAREAARSHTWAIRQLSGG